MFREGRVLCVIVIIIVSLNSGLSQATKTKTGLTNIPGDSNSIVLTDSVVESNIRIRPGRHVCTAEVVVSRPIPVRETYRKPVYKPRKRECSDHRNCPQFDVVYELANRTVYHLQKASTFEHNCCPGWTKGNKREKGCMAPICSNGCGDFGVCVGPEVCKCRQGYRGTMCDEDIDECRNPEHGCQQICMNTAGSYMCACQEGFNLEHDGKTCSYCFTCQQEYKDMMYKMTALQQMYIEQIEKHEPITAANQTAIEQRLSALETQLLQMKEEREQLKSELTHLQTSYDDAVQEISHLHNITELLQRPLPTQPVTSSTKPAHTSTQSSSTSTTTAKPTPTTSKPTTTRPTTTTNPTTTSSTTTTTTTAQTTTPSIMEYMTMTEEAPLEFDTLDLIYSLSNQIGLMEEKLDLCRCHERNPHY